ncbi:MAG: zinc-ribbon domain-containing protein [Acholeplasmataceae bacterium]|nr:MAG: zinc-ribbon domain-containing protein [Acholeplasmataceae bacterium]
MKYCQHCGRQVDVNALSCPSCGYAFERQPQHVAATSSDGHSFGYALLGFIFPLLGFILYLLWRHPYPLRAGSTGRGVLTRLVFYIAGMILIIVFLTSSFSEYL